MSSCWSCNLFLMRKTSLCSSSGVLILLFVLAQGFSYFSAGVPLCVHIQCTANDLLYAVTQRLPAILPPFLCTAATWKIMHTLRQIGPYFDGMNSSFVCVHVVCVWCVYVCVCLDLICIFYSLMFSYYALVPLNSGWRTTGGTRTIV
jgi:hypothetical protein